MAISEDLRNELSDTVREIMREELTDTIGEIVREELGDFSDPSVENKDDESARITPKALKEVEFAFKQYEFEVNGSSLTSATKRTYLLHARNFVPWLSYNFQPGSDNESRQSISYGSRRSRWRP